MGDGTERGDDLFGGSTAPVSAYADSLGGPFTRERQAAVFDLLRRAEGDPDAIVESSAALFAVAERSDGARWAAAAALAHAAAARPGDLAIDAGRFVELLDADSDVLREAAASGLSALARTESVPVDPLFDIVAAGGTGAGDAVDVLGVVAAERPADLPRERVEALSAVDDPTARAAGAYLETLLASSAGAEPPFEADRDGFLALGERLRGDFPSSRTNGFTQQSLLHRAIDAFLADELGESYRGMEIAQTPMGAQIVLSVDDPGAVVGPGGERIESLATTLETDFGLEDPQIDVQEA